MDFGAPLGPEAEINTGPSTETNSLGRPFEHSSSDPGLKKGRRRAYSEQPGSHGLLGTALDQWFSTLLPSGIIGRLLKMLMPRSGLLVSSQDP